MKRAILVIIFVVASVFAFGQEDEKDKSLGWKEGVLGVSLIALAGYILKIEAEHKSERKEWQKMITDQFDRQEKIAQRNNDISREHISVLSAIKALLEQGGPRGQMR